MSKPWEQLELILDQADVSRESARLHLEALKAINKENTELRARMTTLEGKAVVDRGRLLMLERCEAFTVHASSMMHAADCAPCKSITCKIAHEAAEALNGNKG